MRKLISFILLLAMILAVLAGCGNATAPQDDKEETNDPSQGQESDTSSEPNTPKPYEGIPPSVVFTLDGQTEDRLSAQIVTAQELRRMEVSGLECVLFEHWRNADTNQLRLKLSDELIEAFQGQIIRIAFNAYVTSTVKATVQYFDESGQAQQKAAESFATNKWSTFFIQLDKPAFTRGFDGYDFYITFTGPELTRIHDITMMTDTNMFSDQPTLILSERVTDEYIVADVDVRYFGAAGDGVTDDTDSFKSAISVVQNRGGGTVYVPAGKYVLTSTLNLPNGVSLVGELKQGTTDGSVLLIEHGAGTTENAGAAIFVGTQCAVKNICFYYPDQVFVNGKPTVFPPTILQKATESITLANLYFVNAYLAIDCATDHENLSLQHIYNIYGCTLNKFYWNDTSYDIGRVENIYLGPEYWLNSGFEAPDRDTLETWLLNHAIGLHLQRIDWTYISDIHITGYHSGVLANQSSTGASNGHLYNLDFKNVFYGLEGQKFWWFLMTSCSIEVCDKPGALPVYISAANDGNMAFNSCTFKGGEYGVLNEGVGRLSFGNCTLEGSKDVLKTKAAYTLIDCTLIGDNSNFENENEVSNLSFRNYDDISYAPKSETKPSGTGFVDLTEQLKSVKSGQDISTILQFAIDSLRGIGGIVYLPAGSYWLEFPIDVWDGIELRGASEAATSHVSPTKISTDYGANDPDATPLIMLHSGSGLRGLRITYPTVVNEISREAPVYTPYAFTIGGDGSDIYVINVSLHSSFNGIDFATNRCDRHYVQYVWGCPINIGIQVGGGSKDGIIRDVHYTPNCFGGNWDNVFAYIMSHSRCFYVTESENEVLYHNFTYAGWRGIEINDGAKNFVSICHGTDCGNYAAYIGGDCTGLFIDSQLVNLPGGNPDFRAYIYTDKTFEGDVLMVNTGLWGATIRTVYLEGPGRIAFYQGVLTNSGDNSFSVLKGEAGIYGMICPSNVAGYDVNVGNQADACEVIGNLFGSKGKYKGTMEQTGNKPA